MLKPLTGRLSAVQVSEHQSSLLIYDHFRQPNGSFIALCLQDPLDTLAVFTLLKEREASILLLHGELPYQAAVDAAARAGCEGLLYGSPDQYVSLLRQTNGTDTNLTYRQLEPEASLYMYSSGTTGDAKLIRRPMREIDREIEAYNSRLEQLGLSNLSPVVLAPVSHAYGLISGVLTALDRGQEPFVLTGRNPKLALRAAEELPEHLVYGVPLFLSAMEQLKAGSLRFHTLMSSGMLMPETLLERLSSCTENVMQQYGCSEAGCISIAHGLARVDDLGAPLSHLTVQAGTSAEPSELLVDTADGKRIPTGDIGYQADNSQLRYVSRSDDVINVSGLKVFPQEVETVLLRKPGVVEAVVYKGRHPVMGEVVKARIIADEQITSNELEDWCRQHLSPYQIPSEIIRARQIPRGPTGKISRRQLEKEEAVHE